MKKDEILIAISEMTVLELSDLISAIEEKFGVTATPQMIAPVVVGEIVEEKEEEEQTEFDVHIISFGTKKIPVIKVVRANTDLGLKEAKTLVDGAPCLVKEALSETAAAELRVKLEEAGATVEVR